jgi:hypothetical protein
MRMIAAFFGPCAPWALTSHGSIFSSYFKRFDRFAKLATSSLSFSIAKGTQEKRQVLVRLLTEVGQLMVQTRPMVTRLGQRRDRVTQSARATLGAMHEVAKRLIPPIVQWITTGVVAQGKIIHAGKVECGLLYLVSRLGGGYVFGMLIRGVMDESKMPLQALAGYRAIFGAQATGRGPLPRPSARRSGVSAARPQGSLAP